MSAEGTLLGRRILVVDDDARIRSALNRALGLESYLTDTAKDGHEALECLGMRDYDAVVLDVTMPRIDGLEVCRRLRAAGDRTPVLMLTARDGVRDRVAGLDVGADDYVVKPFALQEFLARLRAVMRRSIPVDAPETLRFADLELDQGSYEVHRGGRRLELTSTEYRLLQLFLQNPRQALTRSAIFKHIWGYDFGDTSNSLGVYIGYLRRKLEAGGEPRLLHTIRSVGYVLRDY